MLIGNSFVEHVIGEPKYRLDAIISAPKKKEKKMIVQISMKYIVIFLFYQKVLQVLFPS
jgi:hypothetical protein